MVGGADVGGNAFFLRRDWEDEEEGTRSGCVCANYPRPPPFSDWFCSLPFKLDALAQAAKVTLDIYYTLALHLYLFVYA